MLLNKGSLSPLSFHWERAEKISFNSRMSLSLVERQPELQPLRYVVRWNLYERRYFLLALDSGSSSYTKIPRWTLDDAAHASFHISSDPKEEFEHCLPQCGRATRASGKNRPRMAALYFPALRSFGSWNHNLSIQFP